jgi:prephenate dehydrogenase
LRFERAAIVGVGLIGGSLALAARAAGLIGAAVGVGRSAANLRTALARGIVDSVTSDLGAIGRVDLVVLAVPVRSTATVAAALLPHLAPGTIVTDVGSVKGEVVAAMDALLPSECPFVGAHPIAGSERAGAAAADRTLFRDTRCILTPTPRTDAAALGRVRALWEGVGARVDEMAPAAHDRALAWTSHAVHALAFALVRAIDGTDPALFALGGPSLRDVTRVAASPAELWRDIFLANADAVTGALTQLGAELDRLRAAIAAGDAAALHALIAAAVAAKQRSEGAR